VVLNGREQGIQDSLVGLTTLFAGTFQPMPSVLDLMGLVVESQSSTPRTLTLTAPAVSGSTKTLV
jgi:hypothetical protein